MMDGEPEFYIINSIDRPYPRHIVQKVDYNKFRYVHEDLADWPTMHKMPSTTPLSDFGIEIKRVVDGVYQAMKVRPSIARYNDGRVREWQGENEFFIRSI